ncbi:hypothetical protein NIES2100_63480 [Calothrix sp. NIES-2100]|nr:hypothetical protein NIES2100_63480 [Calothrix sp. NIES-2100]
MVPTKEWRHTELGKILINNALTVANFDTEAPKVTANLIKDTGSAIASLSYHFHDANEIPVTINSDRVFDQELADMQCDRQINLEGGCKPIEHT